MHNELKIEIGRPVADVFRILNDLDSLSLWVGGFVEARITHDAGGEAGTRFHQVVEELGHRVETSGEVLVFEPDRRLLLKLVGDGFETTVDHLLTPLEGNRAGVQVDWQTRFTRWSLKLAAPLIHAAMQKKLHADFSRLKEVLEGGTFLEGGA